MGVILAASDPDLPREVAIKVMLPNHLGKPGYRSHGCVRQHPTNAAYLFAFAPVGTSVVVIG